MTPLPLMPVPPIGFEASFIADWFGRVVSTHSRSQLFLSYLGKKSSGCSVVVRAGGGGLTLLAGKARGPPGNLTLAAAKAIRLLFLYIG